MKITIIGAGNVGASAAKCLAVYELASEIVLYDIVEGVPQGKALDMAQSLAAVGNDTKVVGTNGYAETANSDIVIITAGVPRKPGMSREDLLNINSKIVGDIAIESLKVSPKAIFICVTNPLDVMTQLVWKKTGLPKNRVVGMAGALDNARFRYFLADRLGVAISDVSSTVLGSHGDTMVPILSATTISGVPVRQMITQWDLEKIVARAKDGGGEIVRLLKTGSAYYAPAEAVACMVMAIVKDKNQTIPCSALCEGEYGIKGTYIGVPCRLTRNGVEKIVELPLEADELAALQKSAEVVKENTTFLGIQG
ncbi:MAG TPA: malate dehydrogenase [Treponemataceae bacterium]|nr:malate dehydrogenase [Treponemataceae bacterium]HPS44166.1 malate dehydrogenase [Treponemataceae bacterium]